MNDVEALIRENAELRKKVDLLLEANGKVLTEMPAGLEAIRTAERELYAKLVHQFWLDWDDPVAMQCAEIIERAIRANK